MMKERNTQTSNQKQENSHETHHGEYTFMRQVIKESPRKIENILKKAVTILVSGIAIGAIAAITFAKVLPYFEEEEPEVKVEFPDDEYVDPSQESNGDNEGTESVGGSSDSQDIQTIICPETLTLEGFRQVYEDIVDVAEHAEKAMVIVQGVSSEVDWMNNSYENKTQISGVLVAETVLNYYILTEYRVMENVESIIVTFSDGATTMAEFVKYDPGTGLAVLKVVKKNVSEATKNRIAIATLGSSWTVKRGETVIAIGSPTGYSGSLAYGMVTSTNNVKASIDNQYHLLITDILGDSEGSGVIISLDGEIIGVMAQSFFMEKSQNVLTAISISEVKKTIEKLINDEDITYLGVVGQDISDDLSGNTGIPAGIYVNSIEEDSPAMRAGIQNGDVIVGIGNSNIKTLSQFRSGLDYYNKGDKITVSVMRRSTGDRYVQIVFDVTLGAL